MLLKPLANIPKQSSLGSGTRPICSDLRTKPELLGYFALYQCAVAENIHIVDVLFVCFDTENFCFKSLNYQNFKLSSIQENSLHYTRPPCWSRPALDSKHVQSTVPSYLYCKCKDPHTLPINCLMIPI